MSAEQIGKNVERMCTLGVDERTTMRVSINPEACTGHGRCYTLAPEVFDCDDSGFGVVLSEEIGDDKIAAARLGEQSCPESAITISE